jgi:hypothetical protein
MNTSRRVRNASLTLHVASSVGWFGAVLVYLALGVGAVTSDDSALVAAVYLTMDWAAWVVLVPLAVASLVTGVVQSLVSPWGLLRHYWVVVKLVLTAVATAALLAYTQTLSTFADVAARSPQPADAWRPGHPAQPVGHLAHRRRNRRPHARARPRGVQASRSDAPRATAPPRSRRCPAARVNLLRRRTRCRARSEFSRGSRAGRGTPAHTAGTPRRTPCSARACRRAAHTRPRMPCMRRRRPRGKRG